MDICQAFLNPAAARELPAGTRERALASLSLRQLWHLVFDPCPSLLAAHPPDGKSLLDPFLAHCEEALHPMDWRLHLELLGFLEARAPASVTTVRECLIASASRWCLGDLSPAPGLAVWHPALADHAFCAWKPERVQDPPRIVEVLLSSPPASAASARASLLPARCGDAPKSWLPMADWKESW